MTVPTSARDAAVPLRDDRHPAVVVRTEQVYLGKVWDVRSDTFLYGEGELVREFVDHPGAAAVLAVDAQERVLLIKQYRHPVGLRDWELPAGLLDVVGEEPLLAAQRELAEEVDLAADSWSELVTFHTTPGGSNETVHIFEARDIREVEQVFDRTDEELEIEKRWVPLDEVVAAVLAGDLSNSILIIAVLAAHARFA